ncbi:amidase [Chenggangzhangella methanolivorans]|uniref:Indoleacetamide hydrolase n=2 Tax=Chenggangzhangella methanolivorans TaxID=1437009 RepID=A0A9E6RF10_9HYPH|nr:amidase [Chenggangzhangella methanolivorans]
MRESLRRARATQGSFNAFVLIRDEAAMAAAREADAAVEEGRATGFLHGVPFAAKDLTPTAGDLTTLGSWSSGDVVPTESALYVRRLQATGAILMAKTTTPEFAHSSLTWSPRFGATRNPRDPSRTPGGSSGGSAVAVATGVVPFAEGSDMGGSVRIPASFCGVVGLKPSLGRIPMTILPSVFDDISHFGPLARTIDDAVAFLEATSGPSDEDIGSLPLTFEPGRTQDSSLAGKRFALSVDLGFYAVEPQVEAAIRRAAEAMRAAGAIVEEVALPWTRAVVDEWYEVWCVFMSAYFGDRLAGFRDRMDPSMVAIMERGFAKDATSYKRVELLRTAMWRDMARLFESYDALLCPTCAVTAPPVEKVDGDYFGEDASGRLIGLDMTCPFNFTPQCPALSVPVGVAADGLPVGLQIVGRRFADESVLAIGRGVERLGLG